MERDLTPEQLAQLVDAFLRNQDHIKRSEFYLGLLTGNAQEDTLFSLQLGIAILHDEPLHFLVPEGFPLPDKIKQVADSIERFDPDDTGSIAEATDRVVKKHLKERDQDETD